jgi:hypothetical protein
VLRQLEEERKAATATRKLLDELLAMTQEEAVTNACVKHQSGGSITVNFGDNNSGFQAGRIDGGVSRISFGGSGAYH